MSAGAAIEPGAELIDALPLFPLNMVLFPGALLGLKIFEARYLDLMSACMRSDQAFGVIGLIKGAEAGTGSVQLELVGTLAHIDDIDAEQTGILHVRCHGGRRFRRTENPTQQGNGLWTARANLLPEDPARAPGPAVTATVAALEEAVGKLELQEQRPFAPPYRFGDAGWVANRWCELLPISRSAKQKLMELDDPVIRLSLVDGYLRDKKIIVG